jgi:hypothetical protein
MTESERTRGTANNITLKWFSKDESWDSDCSSEHSLDEIDEFDNECYSGYSAETYGRIIARALASRESSPIEGLAKEIEKKRYFVRENFKLLRYQLQAMRASLRIYRNERFWSSFEECKDQILKRERQITKAEEFMLVEEEVFRNYWPNDNYFSTNKVKRYDQPPDDRRDNEYRATDEWDEHLPDKRKRREEYYYKSSREIERDERKSIACHSKWQMAELRGRSNSDEGEISVYVINDFYFLFLPPPHNKSNLFGGSYQNKFCSCFHCNRLGKTFV